MLSEFERREMYGLATFEETGINHTVWHELTNVFEILTIPFKKHLTDHISNLEENPNLMLVESLLQVYQDKDNQLLLHVLCDLSDWDPLEEFTVCYFSLPPTFKYLVKGKDETFESHKTDNRKVYQNYLNDKLPKLFNKTVNEHLINNKLLLPCCWGLAT